MENVRDVLKAKGSARVETIKQDELVYDAMSKLAEKGIGALLVLNEKDIVVGIVSERDCLRAAARAAKETDLLAVRDIMTKDVVICQPSDDLQTIENTMTQNRIRHLPVIENEQLVGLISIGDIVKARTREMRVENRYLRDYIMGRYPG